MDVSRAVAAPPSAVWQQLAHTRHWAAWGPSVRAVEPSDAQVEAGLTGRVTTSVGVRVRFEVTEVVEGERWSWRVAGIPATGHRVVPIAGGCRATITVPAWAPFYVPVCRVALARIAAAVEATRPDA